MTISRSIEVAANGIVWGFLWYVVSHCRRSTTSSLSIHLSMEIKIVSMSWLFVNSAAMNIVVDVSFELVGFCLYICPEMGLLDHMETLFLVF